MSSDDGVVLDWRSSNSNRQAYGLKRTYANQHDTGSTKGLYLGLLLRALTGGVEPHSDFSEPLLDPIHGSRVNRIGTHAQLDASGTPLIWDGYQRAIETGRVLEQVLEAKIPGSVVEVGVYRGGMSAYLQGILLSQQEAASREMWLIDSFQGLPSIDRMTSAHASRQGGSNSPRKQAGWAGKLKVGAASVFDTMDRFRLLEPGNVHALRGFVNDTLPGWPKSHKIALLRIDVDLYAPIYDTLHFLYDQISDGGVVMFDDLKYDFAKAAMTDFRADHNITKKIHYLSGTVDPMGYWFK